MLSRDDNLAVDRTVTMVAALFSQQSGCPCHGVNGGIRPRTDLDYEISVKVIVGYAAVKQMF